MSCKINLDVFIALIILKVEKFQDSYSFTKVLSWKFKIIYIVDLIKLLSDNKFIECNNLGNGISKYMLTDIGLEYIKKHESKAKEELFKLYKSETKFIELLLAY